MIADRWQQQLAKLLRLRNKKAAGQPLTPDEQAWLGRVDRALRAYIFGERL